MTKFGDRLIESATEAVTMVKLIRENRELKDRIEQLERELAYEAEMNEKFRVKCVDYAHEAIDLRSKLSTERALADELYEDLVHSGISMNRTILKYRKARGL